MKDLYAKLGIDRNASAEDVQAALETRPELSDYAPILLHAGKREIYDSTHSTLKMIGALRLRLGLDSGQSWFVETCSDYAPRQNSAKFSQNPGREDKADTAPAANPATQQPKAVVSTPPVHSKVPAKWLLLAVLLIIGAIVIAVLLW